MGSLEARMKRAERALDEHTTTLRCPVCGVVVRVEGDAALKLLVQDWHRGTGEAFDPDPGVERITTHQHKELAEAAFRDMPGVSIS
jgi:hypothetical protein